MRYSFVFPLLLTAFLISLTPLLTAQDVWKAIPVEAPDDHKPLPFIRAIGIPATATYLGEKHKAFVFISGREKAKGGPGLPTIEVHVEGVHDFILEKDLELFEGPAESDAQSAIRVFSISIKRGKQIYRAMDQWSDLYDGNYPESIVGKADNNVFGTGIPSKGPRRAAWVQLLHEMTSGFDEGHISIG
jgi:hypothetical protein